MVINPHILQAFEHELQRSETLTVSERFALLDGMYDLACQMGHFSQERALEGIDEKIQFAKALHSLVSRTPR